MKHILLIIGISIFTVQAKAQIEKEYYFSDEVFGILDEVDDYIELSDGIIISGKKRIDFWQHEPVYLKIDYEGKIQWSTLKYFRLNMSKIGDVEIHLIDSSFIYGLVENMLVKIDILSGKVTWNTNIYGARRLKYLYSLDLDSNSILAYTSEVYLEGLFYKSRIALVNINKNDGTFFVVRTFPLKGLSDGSYNGKHLISKDSYNNVYLVYGKWIVKFEGNDLNKVIWERMYFGVEDIALYIKDIIIDEHDEIYLLVADDDYLVKGYHGNHILKIRKSDGAKLWYTDDFMGNSYDLHRFVSNGDFIYSISGVRIQDNNDYVRFAATKVRKVDGKIMWDKKPSSSFKSYHIRRSSFDIDCNGDLYIAGSGTLDTLVNSSSILDWMTIKLNGETGEFIWVQKYGDESWFSAEVAVKKNADVYFVGEADSHVQFVKADTSNGVESFRRTIDSGNSIGANTKSIVEKDNDIYVYKQIGNSIAVEKYNSDQVLQWEKKILSNDILKAGQIKVDNGIVNLSAYSVKGESEYPFYNDTTQTLLFYKLYTSNGTVKNEDSLVFGDGVVKPFEMELNNDGLVQFYTTEDSVYCVRWDGIAFSQPVAIESTSRNMFYQGSLNIVSCETDSTYFYAGSNYIYRIDKDSLTQSVFYTYSDSIFYYSSIILGDSLFLSGTNRSGDPILSAYGISSQINYWDQAYDKDGIVYKVITDNAENLFLMGVSRGKSIIIAADLRSGVQKWKYSVDTVLIPESLPLDMELNIENSYLVLCGAKKNSNGSTDVMINVIDDLGTELFSYIGVDELKLKSQANTVSVLPQSIAWVGGSLNRELYGQEGFIFHLHPCVEDLTPVVSIYSKDTMEACITEFWRDTLYNSSGNGNETYLWHDNDTSSQYNMNKHDTGWVSVIVTNEISGCSSSDSVFIKNIIGEKSICSQSIEVNDFGFVGLSPNPTMSELRIDFEKKTESFDAVVHDLLGRNVLLKANLSGDQTTIDVSNLNNGVYFLTVTNTSNQSQTVKFVVKR